jgi:hypothetical protein
MGKGLPYSIGRGPAANAPIKKKTIALRDLAINVSATSTAVGWGTAVISDFEQGNILFLGAVANLQFTTADTDASATWDGDYSIGTTPTADNTLSSTDANIVGSTAIGAATARVSPVARGTGSTLAIFDNTDGSLEINLNMLIDAANITDDTTVNLTVDGELYIAYIVLGDD